MRAKRKYTDEQIVTILPEHAGGVTAKEVIRSHRFSLDTFCRWKRSRLSPTVRRVLRQSRPMTGSSHPRCWNPHT